MAWGITAGTVDQGNSNSYTTSAPSGVQVGDLLVLVLTGRNSPTPTVYPPSGWNLRRAAHSFSAITGVRIFDRIADGTAADTPSGTLTGTCAWNTQIFRITGHAASPFDTAGSTNDSGSGNVNTITTPALTIAEADSLLIAAGCHSDSGVSVTFPGGTGWTEHTDIGNTGNSNRYYCGMREVPSGSYSAETINLSAANQRRILAAVVYKPAAGGGTTHNFNLSETLALADNKAIDTTKVLAESLPLADSRLVSFQKNLAESLSLSDSFFGFRDLVVNLSETLSLSDSLSIAIQLLLELSETLTFTDNKTLEILKQLQEILGLTDDKAFILSKNLQETLALSDSKAFTPHKVLAESLSLVDSLDISLVLILELAEVLTLTDAVTLLTTKVIELSEALAFNDSLSFGIQKVLSEVLPLADNRLISVDRVLNLLETLEISDSLSFNFIKALENVLALDDSLEAILVPYIEFVLLRAGLNVINNSLSLDVINEENDLASAYEEDGLEVIE